MPIIINSFNKDDYPIKEAVAAFGHNRNVQVSTHQHIIPPVTFQLCSLSQNNKAHAWMCGVWMESFQTDQSNVFFSVRRVLIGSPLSGQPAKRTGDVYKCPVGKRNNTCIKLELPSKNTVCVCVCVFDCISVHLGEEVRPIETGRQ